MDGAENYITLRETLVMEALLQIGNSNKLISARLGITPGRVRWSLVRVRQKLGARNTTHAAARWFAQRYAYGFTEPVEVERCHSVWE